MGFFCNLCASIIFMFCSIFLLCIIIFLVSLDALDAFHCNPLNPLCSLAEVRPTSFFDEISASVNTRIDWKETLDAHVFKANLPGVKKEEVKVETEEGRILRISGKHWREKEETKDKWHGVLWRKESFLRRFRLPEDANMDKVCIIFEHGVLTVTVPKKVAKLIDVS